MRWSYLSCSLFFCCFSYFIRGFLGFFFGHKWRLAESELLSCPIQSAFHRLDLGQSQFSPKPASSFPSRASASESAGVISSSASEVAPLPTKGKCSSSENSQSCKKKFPSSFPPTPRAALGFVQAKPGVSLKRAKKSPPHPVTLLLFQLFTVCLCYILLLKLEFRRNSGLKPNF